MGDFRTLRYDAAERRYKLDYLNGTELAFDPDGLPVSGTDRFGNTTTYTWNSWKLTQVTDPAGQVTQLGYDAGGKLISITDPGGRVTTIGRDAAGNLTSIQDPNGLTALRAAYDAEHRLTTSWDRTGAQTDIGYDAYGRVASITAPQVSTTDAGVVRPVTTLHSLAAALLPAPGTGSSTSPAARVVPESAWVTATTPRGAITRTLVNSLGEPTRVEARDAQGKLQVSTWEYNDAGQLVRQTTPKGSSTTYIWSGPDLLIITDQSGGTKTQLSHESAYHQVERVWVNDVLQSTNFYGSAGRLDSTKVGTSVTRYTADSRGRVLTATDPAGHRTTIAYESTGMQNTHSVATSGGGAPTRTTTYAYDAYGRVQSVTDPAGRVIAMAYDAINRDTSVTEPGTTTTHYGYNDATRTYTVTDPLGHSYTTVTNALGWVTSQADPRGGVERFAYDRRGNVTTYTNRRGQQVTVTYDVLDRPLTQTADGQTTTFAYDTASRWVSAANAESTDTLRTDADGRASQAVSIRAGLRYALQASYNAAGLRNALTVTGPWGSRSLGYGYNDLLQLNWLKDASSKAASIAYNQDYLPSAVTLPTGTSSGTRLTQSFSYTSAHRPASLGYSQGVDPALGRRYSYDALERLSTITSGNPGGSGSLQSEVERTVTYDALGRLASYKDVHNWEEEGDLVCPDRFDLTTCYHEIIPHADVLRQASYTYDQVGNRTDHAAVREAGSNRVTSFDGYALSYDADGNVLSKVKAGVWNQSFTWNSVGQLTQVVTNGTTTTFGYDGFGRRVRKTTGGTTMRYLWDGDDLAMELDGAGNGVREYTYYPGTDEPESVRRSSDGAIFYYATEVPGQVAGLVNTSNQVVDSYTDTPFGEPISTTEQVVQPLRYGAREYDRETGLYYNRARYYDPQLGRFLSEDPIGLAGGVNPYVYVSDDPANGRDPSGLCPQGTELVLSIDEAGNWTAECISNGHTTGGVRLAPITVEAKAPWQFATPRDQGATKSFGNPCARGGTCLSAGANAVHSRFIFGAGTGKNAPGGKGFWSVYEPHFQTCPVGPVAFGEVAFHWGGKFWRTMSWVEFNVSASGPRIPIQTSPGEPLELGYQRPYEGTVTVIDIGGAQKYWVAGEVSNCDTGAYHFLTR